MNLNLAELMFCWPAFPGETSPLRDGYCSFHEGASRYDRSVVSYLTSTEICFCFISASFGRMIVRIPLSQEACIFS